MARRKSIQDEVAFLQRERAGKKRELEELHDSYPSSPGYGIEGGEPMGIEMIGRQLDEIDEKIRRLRARL